MVLDSTKYHCLDGLGIGIGNHLQCQGVLAAPAFGRTQYRAPTLRIGRNWRRPRPFFPTSATPSPRARHCFPHPASAPPWPATPSSSSHPTPPSSYLLMAGLGPSSSLSGVSGHGSSLLQGRRAQGSSSPMAGGVGLLHPGSSSSMAGMGPSSSPSGGSGHGGSLLHDRRVELPHGRAPPSRSSSSRAAAGSSSPPP